MDRKDNFDEIIDMDRPWQPETLKKHPKMSPQDRAKIFAPFAALRGHSERLGEEAGKQWKVIVGMRMRGISNMTIIVTGGAGFIGSNFIFYMLGLTPAIGLFAWTS